MSIEQIKAELSEDLFAIGLKYLDKFQSQSLQIKFSITRGIDDIKIEVSDHIRRRKIKRDGMLGKIREKET
jgi:hypothetical protein